LYCVQRQTVDKLLAGDVVQSDDVIAQIETDKVTIDVQHTGSKPGVLTSLSVAAEDTVSVGQEIGSLDDDPDKVAEAGGGSGGGSAAKSAAPKKESPKAEKKENPKPEKKEPKEPAAKPSKPAEKPAPKAAPPAERVLVQRTWRLQLQPVRRRLSVCYVMDMPWPNRVCTAQV
jgi:pyruvate/2-oxoglutarate dehydrogenase complex dihydrolipoamide acyltransferase (E2) component